MAGLGIVALASCNNEEFLDVPQYNILDIETQFLGDDNARLGLTGIYAYNNVSKEDNSWGYKPNLFTGSHPTMDTQCTGWDVKFLNQTWDANVGELGEGWAHAYAAICRANLYLDGLSKATEVTDVAKRYCEGEARALRGYFYTWLATTFGRVPMLNTGEDFNNTPNKAAAETYEEMWDFIIEDFSKAAELLDWKPYDSQYGRCTKGMAKAYLADAYMWKAYRCPGVATECYTKAKNELKSIIDSGIYALSTNFATNWDPAGFWNKECIWAMCSDEGQQWSSWGADRTITFCNPNMFKWFTACPENGGWGSQYLSWEWYSCYEPGDTRRDASCVTGAVPADQMAKYGIEKSAKVWGYHPYLKDSVGTKYDKAEDARYGSVVHPFLNEEGVMSGTKTMQFHFTNGEFAPAIWTTKFWRNAYADGNSWGTEMWCPTIIYGKRYANVLLDYAECLFRTEGENSAEAWNQINTLRNRAFGKLEDGNETALTLKYMPYYNQFANWVGRSEDATFKKERSAYPIPFGSTVATVEDAQTYYTALKAKKGFDSPVWKVAVNTERRKEFNCEWSLRPDMQKSGFMADHVAHNYPKHYSGTDQIKDEKGNVIADAPIKNDPYTNRDYDYNDMKMDMPIPQDELLKNPLCDQNPAYLGTK